MSEQGGDVDSVRHDIHNTTCMQLAECVAAILANPLVCRIMVLEDTELWGDTISALTTYDHENGIERTMTHEEQEEQDRMQHQAIIEGDS